MAESTTLKWFVLRTKSNAEKKVNERLEQSGIESFLPMFITLKQWSDRKKKMAVPYIPGHVFVRSTVQDLKLVYGVQGVTSVLTEFGKPAVVRDVEITNLRLLCAHSEINAFELSSILSKGTEVTIKEGPFKNLTGIVTQTSKGSKVHLLFKNIGMTVVLRLNETNVELNEELNGPL